jgi:hypothetical protein
LDEEDDDKVPSVGGETDEFTSRSGWNITWGKTIPPIKWGEVNIRIIIAIN